MKKTETKFTRQLNPKSRMNGFSLVEVLVAMVVLSIGLLGLAGLQATGLKNNNSAYQRTQANILANEILDRMRANQAGIDGGFYDDPYAGGTPTDPNCITSGCSVSQMAQYDVFEWDDRMNDLLPAAQATITGSGANSIFTITVMWDDERTGATGTSCSGDPDVDLTCYVLNTRL